MRVTGKIIKKLRLQHQLIALLSDNILVIIRNECYNYCGFLCNGLVCCAKIDEIAIS